MVRLTIDDRQVEVEQPATILDAARAAGVELPTLCHHKALLPYGACRLCVVEIGGRERLASACATEAAEGMEVRTASERVVRARRTTLGLLRLRCPGVPKVQELCEAFGADESLSARLEPQGDDCVLCGLCVRVCRERMGRSAIDFVGKGGMRRISTPFDEQSDVCLACGACEELCPTGAIDLREIAASAPLPIRSEFNAGLVARKPVYIPFAQAIPKVPVIDRESCAYFLTGGCRSCAAACGPQAIDYDQQDDLLDLDVGAIVLTSGAEILDPGLKEELGYGRYPNVVSSLQFERLLSASGPNLGKVLRPSDGKPPKRIAFIQCVGSRELDRNYCSSVCCMYATKEAVIAKEHAPETQCTIFYLDLRAYGKGFESYYNRAQDAGVRYIRCRPSQVREAAGSHDLEISYQVVGGGVTEETFDMVVLSVGLRPSKESDELAEILGVERNEHGFVKTGSLAPLETSRPGVFAAGSSSGPKDIPESVMQASGAAAEVMGLLASERGTLITDNVYPDERDVRGEAPRVGVFVCHCGRNIAGTVDVKDVTAYARTLGNVVIAQDNLYTCSTDTQQEIAGKIQELGLNRVIVASCTPRTHEPLFQDTLRRGGLNPYFFEMANIRDQCAWVHPNDPKAATQKAKDLVRMAAAKVRTLEPLYPGHLEDLSANALVIGGGVAGMTAALDLANQGFLTYLLEKEGALGGNALRLRYLPGGEDPQAWLSDLIERVLAHPGIETHTRATLLDVQGTVGNFRTEFETEEGRLSIRHGTVIVATGAQEFRPDAYRYGEDARVLTQLELEERLAAGGLDASSVVMVQCVGSRQGGRDYCSRVCCTQAVKNALRLKELDAARDVFILYRDIRTYGYHEAEYRAARAAGVHFLRFEADEGPDVVERDGNLSVRVKDAMLGETVEIPCDTLVLAAATVARPDAAELARQLKIPQNQHGFFLEAHLKLRPVDFASDGVYVCGLAHSPKSLDESIAQASAAAARASTVLAKTRIELEPRISQVVDENCDGCAYCVDPCPFHAISLVEYMKDRQVKKVAESDPTRCRGCGVCMATCPKEGIYVKNFRLEQISAMVEAALDL